jgi:1A family penicillin-binding protein
VRYSPSKIPDENLSYKIAKKSLKLTARLLSFIGKPFYIGLLSIIIFSIYLYYGIKKITQKHDLVLLKTYYTLPTEIRKFFVKQKLFFLRHDFRPKVKRPKNLVLKVMVPTIIVIFASTFFWTFILEDLPSPKELSLRSPEVSTKIYDRNGVLLYKIYKDKNRTPVSLKDLPREVILSTLAIEDSEFYYHSGFSIRGMLRAGFKNILNGELTGGSTITQQLVKNTLLSPEKTITRKVRELVLAVEVELYYNKDQILEMYLNEVPFGGTAYGIQEASQVYFGKDAKNLTLAEAALLAGLPKSPTKYSPNGNHPESAFLRQKEVLNLMVSNSFITADDMGKALNEKITFAENRTEILAPHFVMYVKEELEEKYGEDMLEKGGLSVVTTLDMGVQKMAEEMVAEEVAKLKNYKVGNGAALVVNPQTGEILAMVGSKDFFDIQNQGNVNILTSLQQPGSSIKIVNYTYALSHGYTPSSIVDDSPVTFNVRGSAPYSPKNYDGKFLGKLTLRNAFAQSRNVPAVKVLATYGVNKMIEQGQKMGITTWSDPSKYGLSITLGGADIKPIDLAQVYSVIANYGTKVSFNPITKITDFKGKVLEDGIKREGVQVVDPRVAYILTDILKDNTARAPAFGTNSLLNIQGHKEVAVKTGTSNSLRDNLAIGYNQYYLVATWVGNNDNSPMARIASGVTGATPIFNKIMTNLLKDKSNHTWEVPEGIKKISICYSFKKPDSEEVVTKKFEEWFLLENIPKNTCSQPKSNNG